MDTWRDEILEGLDQIPVLGTPGEIVVYGETAEPVAANSKGQVLIAAAEYGKGRVVVFCHSNYTDMKNVNEESSNEDVNRLMRNVKKWVTRNNPKEDLVIKNVMKRDAELENADILVDVGGATPPWKRLNRLKDYVHGGGGMIIGETPWGFLQVRRQYTLKTMPMNVFLGFIGMAYTAEYFKSGNNFTVSNNRARYAHLLRALKVSVDDVEQFEKHGAVISRSIRQLPEKVFNSVQDTVMDIIKNHCDKIHVKPSYRKPCGAMEEKALINLMVEAFKHFGEVHDIRKVPSAADFPGDFEEQFELECTTLNLKAPDNPMRCYHATGWYVPAGVEVIVKIKGDVPTGENFWSIAIGSHTDELFNNDSPWKRWPTLHVKTRLKQKKDTAETEEDQCTAEEPCEDPSVFRLKSHAGGLLYFISHTKTESDLEVQIENVVQAPFYDIDDEDIQKNWDERKNSPGLWADLIGRKSMFSIPKASALVIEDPKALLEYWDRIVETHYDLVGASDDPRPRMWIVADEHPKAGYMHAGYPIVTGLDVVNPKGARGSSVSIIDVEPLIKGGSWGLFHEMGHNLQDNMWTFEGTSEVTVNIFTLHAMDVIQGIDPWIHPWLQRHVKKLKSHFRSKPSMGAWSSDPGKALFIYAQLARDFGWETYKSVFREYRGLKGPERPRSTADKIQQWIVRFSKHAGANLCPLFEFWGFNITEKTKNELDSLPPHLKKDEVTDIAPDHALEICQKYGLEEGPIE